MKIVITFLLIISVVFFNLSIIGQPKLNQANTEENQASMIQVEDSSLYLQALQSQTIILPYYWSIFSTYLIPENLNIANTTQPVLENISIIKNYQGQSYWPQYGVNLIGNMVVGQSYQAKMLAADTLVIYGTLIIPEITSIVIPYYWSLLGYIRTTPASIIEMLQPIVNNISIVKNYHGQSFWPQFGVNLIGEMNPGEGYQIKMLEQDTLIYPANAAEPILPSVTTSEITDILATTSTSGGVVSSDGGSPINARGVCWNTTGSPTLADNYTSNGTGTGAFSSNLTNLLALTTYYIRAYATNSVGTAFGNEI